MKISGKALLLLSAGAIVLGGAAFSVPFAAKETLEKAIHKNGFPAAYVEGLKLYPNGITMDWISLDANQFSLIEDIQIELSWFDFLSRQEIASVNIASLELSGEIDDSGRLTLAGWDATPPKGTENSAMIALRKLALGKATLDLETPQGSLRTEGKLSLQTQEGGQKQTWQASLRARQKQMSFSASLTGEFSAQGAWSVSSEIQDGQVDMDGFQISRLTGWIDAQKPANSPAPAYAGQVEAGRVNVGAILFQNPKIAFDTAKKEPLIFEAHPSGFPDITLSGKWLLGQNTPIEATFSAAKAGDIPALLGWADERKENFAPWLAAASPLSLTVKTSFADATSQTPSAGFFLKVGALDTEIFGNATYDKSKKILRVNLPEFGLGAAAASALLPRDITKANLTAGDIKIWGSPQFDFSASPATITGPLSVSLQGIGGTWNDYPFEGLITSVDFAALSPWKISSPAKVSLKKLVTGTPVTDLTTSLAGSQTDGLSVGKSDFSVGGGKASLSPFHWKERGKINTTLSLSGVDLKTLSREFQDFQAEGILNGSFPLEYNEDGLTVRAGKIESVSSGAFRYAPNKFPSALQGDDARMQTVRQALSDFHFSSLSLSVDGNPGGGLKTTLKAEGTNPAFGERPIQLNLNLEGDLAAALQQALQPGSLPDTLTPTGE
jgi:hypothetical protein